jgi:hypothetical protein
MQSSKRRQAESKERDLAAAEKRLAQLLGKKSKVEADLVRNLNSLQRVEDQARRQQETEDKRRREEELRHVQQVTREVERQSRLQASMPRGQLTVELGDEHEIALQDADGNTRRSAQICSRS